VTFDQTTIESLRHRYIITTNQAFDRFHFLGIWHLNVDFGEAKDFKNLKVPESFNRVRLPAAQVR
jgi:hypothetical protein